MKRSTSRLSRRAALAGIGAAAVAPTLWLRRARAQTAAFAAAQHTLVLFARGGLRSHCLFNAVGTTQHNPYGALPNVGGAQWSAGTVLGADDIETETFGLVPGLHQLTQEIAVLTSVDLEPDAPRPLVDHAPAIDRLATGLEGSNQGLLSRVRELHPRYANGVGVDNVPPIAIGPTPFAVTGRGFVPLQLPPASATVTRQPLTRDWSSEIRDALDQGMSESTATAYAARLDTLATAKRDAFDFSSLLIDPQLDVRGAPEASALGVSNAELLEVLGDDDLADLGDPQSERSWGPDVALGVRALGLGAPMVVVERDLYDTHSDEDASLPVRSADLGRQLAGLRFLLGRMEHPLGGSFWDHTVVTVLSEFNRNNTEADTGYNSGNGSDHQLLDAFITRNQAVPLLGGPIERAGLGGTRWGSTDDQMRPQEPSLGMRRVYSTLLDLLGAPHGGAWPDLPLTEVFG